MPDLREQPHFALFPSLYLLICFKVFIIFLESTLGPTYSIIVRLMIMYESRLYMTTMQNCASSACSNQGRWAASGQPSCSEPHGEKHFYPEEPYREHTHMHNSSRRLREICRDAWLARRPCAGNSPTYLNFEKFTRRRGSNWSPNSYHWT